MKRIIVDAGKCTGCRLCQYICSFRFVQKGFNPKIAGVRVVTVGLMDADVPILCRQCKHPRCQAECPVQAVVVQENGLVVIEQDRCIGCGVCAEVCPFGAIALHPEVKTPVKCDLCGGDPECVKFCIAGALSYQPEVNTGEERRNKGTLLLGTKRGGSQ